MGISRFEWDPPRGDEAASSNRGALGAALEDFRLTHPEYAATAALDLLRQREYARLDAAGHIYLDYAGGGLYAESQVREHAELLRTAVLGNPHSINPTSLFSTSLIQRARAAVLEYFRASPDEFVVIFTANASAALKLVGESYPFEPGGRLLLSADSHNSVNGLRELARARGAPHTYVPVTVPDLRLPDDELRAALARGPRRWWRRRRGHLFAYPAQSNFSGVQHSLEWIAEAQERGWDVLLDASAFVPTNRLDLDRWRPDFVALSFYKMMGYPTGVGCLIARKAALAKLRRPWFAGGAVFAVSVRGDAHRLAEPPDGFEDGTVDYLAIPAVEIGLRHLTEIGIDVIHQRVTALTDWLLAALRQLRHDNGRPLVLIYGPPTTIRRGSTIAFNFLDRHGRVVDERLVERLALERRISLRTGCFCNPGASEIAFAIGHAAVTGAFRGSEVRTYDRYLEQLGMPSAGGIRISLGLASSFADVFHFVDIAREVGRSWPPASGLPPRNHC
jgi:molybdenum cofactor sulfurtransferase